MPKESGRKVVATNRKARHNYLILDTYEAGIALMGTEVKSLREGHASMVDGFCTFYNDELWMEGIHIPEYHQGAGPTMPRAGVASSCCTAMNWTRSRRRSASPASR